MASLKQEQSLKLGQKLSPKQILFTRLLEVPSFQLEQRIQQDLRRHALDAELPLLGGRALAALLAV